MSAISLQPGIIYGPVLSRRLGRSLGINLLPADRKVCSFDCIYCQYGPLTAVQQISTEYSIPTVGDVLSAVEKALRKPRTIEFLTFSGNGEPTLHPNFAEIVQGVKRLRDQLRPTAKLAILSNASRVTEPGVLSVLGWLDAPMMKLDAGDQATFLAINRPAQQVRIVEIIEGLKAVPGLMIQSMLLTGKVSNSRGEAYERWTEALVTLQPRLIHIYSIDRPTAEDDVIPVSGSQLKNIRDDLHSRFGLPVEAFWRS